MTQHEEENDNLHKADQVYFLYDPQPVRLLDVVYVGPVMIYAGLKGKNLNQFVKWSLIGVGICTILYNGANFFINEKKAADKRKAEKKLKEALKISEALKEVAAREEKQKQEEELSKSILHQQNNIVEQEQFNGSNEQPESLSLKGVTLPKEVADMFSMTNEEPAIKKKSKGRPPKASIEDSKLIQQNGRSNSKTTS